VNDSVGWAVCGGVGRPGVLLAVTALAQAFDFPVFEGQEEVVVDRLQWCQRLEAANRFFRRLGRESGNGVEGVIRRRRWRGARQYGERK
jgi:hypothetical protein